MSGNTNSNTVLDVVNIQAHFTSLSAAALAYLNSVISTGSPLVLTANNQNEVPLTIEAYAGQIQPLLIVKDQNGNAGFQVDENCGALIESQAAAEIPLIVRAAAAQSANLLEIRNSADAVTCYIASNGYIGLGAPAAGSYIYQGGNGVTINNSFNELFSLALYKNPQLNVCNRLGIGYTKYSLTDAAANNFCTIACAAGTMLGGYVDVAIVASDGVDYQTRIQRLRYSAVNKGGVITAAVAVVDESASVSVGTLTATWAVTTGANSITLQVTPTSSLVPTQLDIWGNVSSPYQSVLS